MKKFWIRLGIFMVGMVGLAWANNAVMLHFHPLAYYCTPPGMVLSAVVCSIEVLILWPLSTKILERWIIPAANEGLSEEKEKLVTEFKEIE